jgi:hypothetical protein
LYGLDDQQLIGSDKRKDRVQARSSVDIFECLLLIPDLILVFSKLEQPKKLFFYKRILCSSEARPLRLKGVFRLRSLVIGLKLSFIFQKSG